VEPRPRRRRRGNVPADLTTFVGRRSDIADVKNLLATSRLVSLVGPGGVGKTRLVLRIALELRRAFVDGVWFVDLADLRDPNDVPHAIAAAIGVDSDQPETAETLGAQLREDRMLLILDTCEHLVEACADIVSELLRAAGELRVLMTTRQPLRVGGELVHLVAPLDYPDTRLPLPPGAATQFAAMALFVDRARAVVPDFAVTSDNEDAVARLCERLEGMPLAIELAALSLRVLSVQDLVARLDDPFEVLTTGPRTVPSRHRSLEAAVDWSYALCTSSERALWARCSVFAGHFDRDAAVAVCADGGTSADDVLGLLAGLVDKSVISREEHDGSVRFGLSETLRAYGDKKLTDLGAGSELRDRHLDYFEALLDLGVAESFGPDQERSLIALQLDHANIRAALEYATVSARKGGRAMRLASQAWFYWIGCGHLSEGAQWLERALAASSKPSADRAHALATSALIAALQGRLSAAEDYAAAAEKAAEAVRGVDVRARTNHVRGLAALFAGDLGLAADRLTAASGLYAAGGVEDALSTLVEVDRAVAYVFDGRTSPAAEAIERCRQVCLAHGDRWVLSHALRAAALVEFLRGDLGTSAVLVEESLTTKRRFHDLLGIALGLDILAWVAAASGEPERAAMLLGAAHRQWTVVGQPLFGSKHYLALRAKAEETARRSDDPAYEDAYARGAAFEAETAVAYALREPEPKDVEIDSADPAVGLTRRESQVAELVGRGLSNKEIAATLVISQRTAEGHVQRILTKFGFTSRSQVATWVAEQRQPGG
jgi:predicted ATPase/DNA-binding CsgD family transcriptional regulator